MAELKEKNRKIPIGILGGEVFALCAGLDDFTFGTFTDNLEQGIREVIEQLIRNAHHHIEIVKEGRGNAKAERDMKYVEAILNYKGREEEHFYLMYYRDWRSYIEPNLGKFGSLERVVL